MADRTGAACNLILGDPTNQHHFRCNRDYLTYSLKRCDESVTLFGVGTTLTDSLKKQGRIMNDSSPYVLPASSKSLEQPFGKRCLLRHVDLSTKLQPFSNGTAKKWLAGPQER